MSPPFSPWLGPGNMFPYAGFPAMGASPWTSVFPDQRESGKPTTVCALFEAQLKAYEEMIRAYKRMPSHGPTAPWRQQQMDILYQAYLTLVQAYRRYLHSEMGDC